jgi:hypothetical protein
LISAALFLPCCGHRIPMRSSQASCAEVGYRHRLAGATRVDC